VSHSLAGWGPPTLLALWLGGDRRPVARGVACLWSHLLLDSYADGIAWLWPVDEEKIGLFRKPDGIRDSGWSTPAPLSTEVGKIELGMWLVAAAGLVRRGRRRR
jgi:hypothetical protein